MRLSRQAIAPPPPLTDDALTDEEDQLAGAVRQAKMGDKDGVRRFLQDIAPPVRRTCRNVLGSGHPDLEDTIQECLFAALNALPQYRFDGSVRHYVTKISWRMAIAARRRRSARWRQHDSIDTDDVPILPAATPAWSTDDIDLVRGVIENLTAVQSEALLMRIVLGFSVEEIAGMTGVSQNTVKTRLRLGKNALRKEGRKPFWKRWFLEPAR